MMAFWRIKKFFDFISRNEDVQNDGLDNKVLNICLEETFKSTSAMAEPLSFSINKNISVVCSSNDKFMLENSS